MTKLDNFPILPKNENVIGIIGGGQLGKMIALSASKAGYKTHLYCPKGDNPAEAVVDKITHGQWDDYNKLVEIFYNIVQNAIKYSNSNTQINITQFKNTDNVTIKVKDQGYGIPKTSIPRVTERFFRVDPEHSKKIGGTGLGLAIVKHLINQHRGEFHIESEIGKGSEFFVKLPLHN